jgi:putative nucleotidyltransferase with HDIG domain
MDREQAKRLLDEFVTSDWLKKHSLATAEVMAGLAVRLGQDPEAWWVAGLLHDLDFDLTQDPAVHGRRAAEILRERGAGEELAAAVMAHNAEGLGVERRTPLDFALTAGESITGLIVATALVMPDKKLASVSGESVVKRMKKKDFARKVSRERVLLCERVGLPIEEFASLAVAAMQRVARELGL